MDAPARDAIYKWRPRLQTVTQTERDGTFNSQFNLRYPRCSVGEITSVSVLLRSIDGTRFNT
jgi:hypothetical protein